MLCSDQGGNLVEVDWRSHRKRKRTAAEFLDQKIVVMAEMQMSEGILEAEESEAPGEGGRRMAEVDEKVLRPLKRTIQFDLLELRVREAAKVKGIWLMLDWRAQPKAVRMAWIEMSHLMT